MFFSTHSYYVYGSWHELRTFHLRTDAEGLHLDETYGEIGPPTSYETAIVVYDAIVDYVAAMSVPTLDVAAVSAVAARSQAAAEQAGAAFADYVARGGLDELLGRHDT